MLIAFVSRLAGFPVNLFARPLATKRAPQRGALFICLLFCTSTFADALSTESSCAAGRIDETVAVAQVVDGDTLRLHDGRSVRLIGINTPEIGRKGKPSEPLAEQARKTLQALLGKTSKVGLRVGRESHDRYGRLLAHIYLPSGENVEAHLLEAGLAAQIVVPPNVGHLDCYRAAEQRARRSSKGVWSGIYRPTLVGELSHSARGFRIIRGRIVQVGESKRSVWLNFQSYSGKGPREGVAVRIARTDLERFTGWTFASQPQSLRGKMITARGWMYLYKKQLVMRVRHPASMEIQ